MPEFAPSSYESLGLWQLVVDVLTGDEDDRLLGRHYNVRGVILKRGRLTFSLGPLYVTDVGKR
jgi:hypothetical protein